MINLDQVRTLEWKVKQAVQLIVHLRRENDTLRGRLSDTEVRLQELETLLETFKATQNEMESGIRSALEELDNLEAGEPSPVPETAAVESVAYPPAAPEVAEVEASQTFASDEPSAQFERTPTFHEETADPAPDLSFEEEFAALAAEEAAAIGAVPESIELEAEAGGEVAVEPEEPEVHEAEAPAPEEKRLEQPGLGIF